MSWDWDKLKQQQQDRAGGQKVEPPIKPEKKLDLLNNPWIIYPGYFLIWVIFALSLWFPVRWFHYKFSYEKKIQKQIIEMVNPESLKKEYRK